MNSYKIVWITSGYAESVVYANSVEEATQKALLNEDQSFEELPDTDDWEIDEVILIEEEE